MDSGADSGMLYGGTPKPQRGWSLWLIRLYGQDAQATTAQGSGADGGTRTHGLRITSAPLYR